MAAREETSVRSLRTAEALREEASAWIARLNADDVSQDDRARFEAWRGASVSHARAFDEVSRTWRYLQETGTLVSSVAIGHAFSASTHRAIERSKRASRLRAALASAACLVFVGLAAVWWWRSLPSRTLFQTAIGEHAAVQLPDGSALELNSNSRARIDYTEQARVIQLERGEAFFQVAHDVRRPFWVVADGSWVRAVGTAFNVDMRSSGVRVTVSEGTVKVAAQAPTRSERPSDLWMARASVSVLAAGHQADMHGSETRVSAVAPGALNQVMSWRRGSVYFKSSRLADVVDELSRYTTMRIVIESDELRDLSVGGTFETNPSGAEALLTTLQDGFNLQVRREGNTAYLSALPRK